MPSPGAPITAADVAGSFPAVLASDDVLAEALRALEPKAYAAVQHAPATLLLKGEGIGNPERTALEAVGLVKDHAVTVWAVSARGSWAIAAWRRPDLVTVTNRTGRVRWRHRKLPSGMAPTAQPFLEGSSSPHDLETRPKHQPTEAARAVLAELGATDAIPLGIDIEPEPVTARRVEKAPPRPAPRRTAVRKSAAPPKPKKVEPEVKVCPRCFMQLPATGVCDNCG